MKPETILREVLVIGYMATLWVMAAIVAYFIPSFTVFEAMTCFLAAAVSRTVVTEGSSK